MAAGKIKLDALTTLRAPFNDALNVYQQLMLDSSEHVGVILEYPTEPQTEVRSAQRVSAPKIPEREPARIAKPVTTVDVIGAGNFARTMLLPHLKGQVQFGTVVNQTSLSANHVKTKFGFQEAATNMNCEAG